MKLFENLGFSQQLTAAIDRLGLKEPTQIQEKSIPLIIKGKDVIGESATGSGKTLAFGCGIIENTIPGKKLQALVLTPTRELAEQVTTSLKDLSYKKPLNIISIYGGVAINPQISALTKAEVVVATPGRLLDHLERNTINTSGIKILVLDEADRMFDMGFLDDVEKIIKNCPKKRQTMFFSATMFTGIKRLAEKYMVQPKKVSVVNQVDPAKLKQCYYNISKNKKLSLLVHLLKEQKSALVMIFCNTRKNTDFVVRNLRANRIKATSIHGGMTQNKRTKTIQLFNENKVKVLVCTDVAARGLHIDNVSHVYNYDIPKNPKDYVHRIGRTARAGETGKVINLLCDYDHDNFSRILTEYRMFSISPEKTPELQRIEIRTDNTRKFQRKTFNKNNSFKKNRRKPW
ncbi:ATP-dependent RNA helicase [Candidatus Woesearchaeota archaeon ex4484_78]|nr:MAG: ATP-dependent RNA helicase [Candidatus Woesearchaeota archaeon ex4484_78]